MFLVFLLFWIAACMKRGEIWARVFIPSNFLGWNCETSPPSGIIWFDIPRYDRRRLETGHNFMFLVIWPIIITGMYIWNDGTPPITQPPFSFLLLKCLFEVCFFVRDQHPNTRPHHSSFKFSWLVRFMQKHNARRFVKC